MPTLVIQAKPTRKGRRYFEDLGNDVRLEMVLIEGGQFMMGSPEQEEGHQSTESPQQSVNVPTFFMGRYPITQKQWRALLQNSSTDLDPNPSSHKNKDDHPVEQVSWDDASEYCSLLSAKTDRQYRLPSEAEWEYACRAGTTTPFYLGETLTDQVANFNASSVYGKGESGEYKEATTSINEFDAPNEWGLCDMHGNVLEWCADHWHENYDGAPTDGSPWVKPESRHRVLRGGSWLGDPAYCRSASRINATRGARDDYIGFRVVCVVRGTP